MYLQELLTGYKTASVEYFWTAEANETFSKKIVYIYMVFVVILHGLDTVSMLQLQVSSSSCSSYFYIVVVVLLFK